MSVPTRKEDWSADFHPAQEAYKAREDGLWVPSSSGIGIKRVIGDRSRGELNVFMRYMGLNGVNFNVFRYLPGMSDPVDSFSLDLVLAIGGSVESLAQASAANLNLIWDASERLRQHRLAEFKADPASDRYARLTRAVLVRYAEFATGRKEEVPLFDPSNSGERARFSRETGIPGEVDWEATLEELITNPKLTVEKFVAQRLKPSKNRLTRLF